MIEIIGKNGEKIPQIYSEDYERKPEFKADREVRILKDGTWELFPISKVKAGDRFRITAIPATGFTVGYDNEYLVVEYEAITDANIGANGAWEVDCFVWEKEGELK